MFHVGQKVVCVYSGTWQVHGHETTPKHGCVYTIRAIDPSTSKGPGLLFYEIKNRPDQYVGPNGWRLIEKRWWAMRFRPIQERKTDISIFKAMLTPKKVRVEA